jgi:hypothetical protein
MQTVKLLAQASGRMNEELQAGPATGGGGQAVRPRGWSREAVPNGQLEWRTAEWKPSSVYAFLSCDPGDDGSGIRWRWREDTVWAPDAELEEAGVGRSGRWRRAILGRNHGHGSS